MIILPKIDPVAFSVWKLEVHWYGLMYLCAFASCYGLAHYRARTQLKMRALTPEQIGDWVFYSAIGVVLGGRLGYCLFYQPSLFLQFGDSFPYWGALEIHKGGMSFHGGFLGVLAVGIYWYGRQIGSSFLHMTDFLSPTVPLGLFFGRIGNFINAELWGKPTDLPWGMVFPGAGGVARHPSMLYEAALEGLLMWAVLWWYSSKPRPRGAVSALFLIIYGVSRFIVEFVRVPDEHLSYLAFGWVTMGQILSLPMVLLGLYIIINGYRKQALASK